MKIIHTSDWHLGHRLLEQSQHEEQTLFLEWLLSYIRSNNIDVLLISGDVFDVGVPSAQAQKLYYDFLVQLHQSCCKEVIITAGNHDAPSTLNAPKELLNALNIRVVGKATDEIGKEIFSISDKEEHVLVAAIPYLRDQDIRRSIAGETANEIVNRYKNALVKHFREVADVCEEHKISTTKTIAMGHLFAIGGQTTDSEQSIYVGNLGDIGADDFPTIFDYVALGHLHRPQKVGNKEHIRYSGSPYVLSFGEIGHCKKIIEIDTNDICQFREIEVPAFRKMLHITGSVESCKQQLDLLNNESHDLTPWVEVILSESKEAVTGYKQIHEFAKNIRPEILKVTIKDDTTLHHLKNRIENIRHVKSLTPHEVFNLRCEEKQIDLNEEPELLDAFNEILQIVIHPE